MPLCHFDRFPYTVICAEDADLGPQIFAIAQRSREPGTGQPGVDIAGATDHVRVLPRRIPRRPDSDELGIG